MVYTEKERYDNAIIRHTDSQKKALGELAPFIRGLNKLHGEALMTPAADEWFTNWYKTGYRNPANKASCLNNYYDTKNMQLMKMAMAVHFSERTDMVVDTPAFEQALEILDSIEPNMHLAYAGERDIRGEVIGKLKALLKNDSDGLTSLECYPDVYDIIELDDFNKLLADLMAAGLLARVGDKYMLTGRNGTANKL